MLPEPELEVMNPWKINEPLAEEIITQSAKACLLAWVLIKPTW